MNLNLYGTGTWKDVKNIVFDDIFFTTRPASSCSFIQKFEGRRIRDGDEM